MSSRQGNAIPECPGADELFAGLYERHYQAIRKFCCRRVASDRVDDAVAETFLVAWRRIESVPLGDSALLWLYRVAYRVIGHEWRTTARRRRLEDRLRTMGGRPDSAADNSVGAGDELRLVLAAMNGLGATDAEVLRLVAWEQLSPVDVAAVLRIGPNAAKQRLHRARRNLAREYGRLDEQRNSAPNAPKRGAL